MSLHQVLDSESRNLKKHKNFELTVRRLQGDVETARKNQGSINKNY